MPRGNVPLIEDLEVGTYRVPTDAPESDGTLKWDHTDVVIVQITAGGSKGLGWSYAAKAAAHLVDEILRATVVGRSAFSVEGASSAMNHSLRNVGVPGAGSMAVAAVDIAMWDLKAKLLDLSLLDLFGAFREGVELYASGGFTSYSEERLADQLGAGPPRELEG